MRRHPGRPTAADGDGAGAALDRLVDLLSTDLDPD